VQLVLAVTISVAFLSGAAALIVPRRIRPHVAARLIMLLAVAAGTATAWALLLVATANVVQLHGIAERLSWCSGLVSAHRGTLSPSGVAAIAALTVATVSILRVWRRQRRLRAPRGEEGLVVVESARPAAFTLAGRPGQIIVSSGMLRTLQPEERRVLLAHERAHLRCHHHRYVQFTELATAAMPVLRPVIGRVRYAVERWADEEAAREIGDRRVVARAIARAAVAQTEFGAGTLAIADTEVLARVKSLMQDAPHRAPLLELGLSGVSALVFASLGFSVALVEPWAAELIGLCPPH
jgi:hypothetical protein